MTNNQSPTADRPIAYAAAHFALELSGVEDVAVVRSIEGGGLKAEVMTHQIGATYERWRQLGKPKFEDIKLQLGTALSRPFLEWISNFFAGKCERKNGAIVAGDFHYKERARREFSEALITELTIPKFDANDKSTVYMNVTLGVEDIVYKTGDGRELNNVGNPDAQKAWKACNFHFRIDGFECCSRATKIDSFTIKHSLVEYHSGGRRTAVKTPGMIEYPQISFYLPEADAQPLADHFKRRGIDGEVPGRLHGQIETFGNAKDAKFTLEFFGADIVSIQPDKSDSTSEELKQVKVDLYVERMSFKYRRAYDNQ